MPSSASVAAACLLVVLLAANPGVAEAMAAIFEPFTIGTPNTVYIDQHRYAYNDGNLIISGTHSWNIPSETVSGKVEEGQWLSTDLKAGKLNFTANKERIDITELISYDDPFTYIYTDKYGIVHYIIVGGEFTAENGLQNVGKAEFLQYEPAAGNGPSLIDAGWMGGYTANCIGTQGEAFPWVIRGYEALELPLAPPEG